MKIPKSVRISGVEYDVILVPDLNDRLNLLYGEIDHEKCLIKISSTSCESIHMKCITLLHEILHGIRNSSGVEIDNEEQIVDMFSRGLYQVLQDNQGRLFGRNQEE